MKKADFQTLANMRIREAGILFAAGEWNGAYYLAGYAVECALKACIIKRLNSSDFWPDKRFSEDCYKHDLKLLLKLADLQTALDSAVAVKTQWGFVEPWSEQSRYEHDKDEAVVRPF